LEAAAQGRPFLLPLGYGSACQLSVRPTACHSRSCGYRAISSFVSLCCRRRRTDALTTAFTYNNEIVGTRGRRHKRFEYSPYCSLRFLQQAQLAKAARHSHGRRFSDWSAHYIGCQPNQNRTPANLLLGPAYLRRWRSAYGRGSKSSTRNRLGFLRRPCTRTPKPLPRSRLDQGSPTSLVDATDLLARPGLTTM